MTAARRRVLRIIQCQIGEQSYALDMDWVRSVQRADRLRRRGGTMLLSGEEGTARQAPGEPCGWLNSGRGDLPVYDLGVLLGLSPARIRPDPLRGRGSPFERVIVLDSPMDRGPWRDLQEWGLLVDAVSQVVHVEPGQASPLGDADIPGVRDRFSGLMRIDGKMMLCLQPGFLFPGAVSASPYSTDTASGPMHPQGTARLLAAGKVDSGNGSARRRGAAGSISLSIGPGYRRILLFSLPGRQDPGSDLSFALSISQVPEILESRPMITLPGAPPSIQGLIDWRERPVMLVDLGVRLGLEGEAEPLGLEKLRIIIARDRLHPARTHEEEGFSPSGSEAESLDRGVLVGILADTDVRVIDLPEGSRINKTGPDLDLSAVRGVVEFEGRTVVIPDISGVLGFDGDWAGREEPVLAAHGREP